jgi:hypothetical protein
LFVCFCAVCRKKDFGVKVWDVCAAGGDYKPIFEEFAPKVKELEAKIAETKKELDVRVLFCFVLCFNKRNTTAGTQQARCKA